MVTFNQVSKYYGTQDVLKNISCRILKGNKIGLIGSNGAGKTTMIRLLLGKEETSSGKVIREKGIRIGYVPQYIEHEDKQTVEETLLADFKRIEAKLRKEENDLATVTQENLEKALARYQDIRDAFDRFGGDDIPKRAESLLTSLGLAGKLHQSVGSLSGGEKNILSFAQALLERPDILILDEPGNHLDYIGLAWLEKFLTVFPGAVLIVSHNRYLLDRIVSKIFELDKCMITEYEGNYSTYRMTKLRNLVAQQSDYVANQKRLAQLEALVKRFKVIARNSADPAWGKRLRARKSQLKREQKQAVRKPELNQARISLNVEVRKTKADIALQVNSYSKRFGQRRLFEDASLEISCGGKAALVGPNGCGKTTFLKDVIENAGWDNTVLRIGPSLTVGYCAQNQEIFNPDATILEEFLSLRPSTKNDVFSLLSRFLFTWEDMDKQIKDLSGGEKNRLQLARLMILETNFLILDEPTNHLDIPAREAIEESLSTFNGTILVVSHDRYFIDKIATSIVEIKDRKFYQFYGNFSEFWAERRKVVKELDGRASTRSREYNKVGEKRKSSPSSVELRITVLEEEKLKVESELSRAFSEGDRKQEKKLSDTLEKLTRQIDRLYDEWGKGEK
jgi:ATP-binding cassette subfamily F protein 3